MRAVIQRVNNASVSIGGEIFSRIEHGLLVFLGITEGDSDSDLRYICDKILGLRIFEDANGKMNLSLQDISGEVLVVSQFTLYGDARHGRRPSFSSAALPSIAEPLYNAAIELLASSVTTKHGVFGADMQVSLVNDGPVTILLDSTRLF